MYDALFSTHHLTIHHPDMSIYINDPPGLTTLVHDIRVTNVRSLALFIDN